MKVHEAARLLGVTPRALRFYEERGLVAPAKDAGSGYRQYETEDLETLRWIVALRELGLPIPFIADALAAREDDERFRQTMDRARAELYEQWVDLSRRLESLDRGMESWRGRTPAIGELEALAAPLKEKRSIRSAWSARLDFDDMAVKYREDAPLMTLSPPVDPRDYEEALTATADWIDARPEEAGLDLGSGTGNLAGRLAASGAAVTGVEQSPAMIRIMRSRFPELPVKQGNLLALPLPARTYRFAGSSFALQHLREDERMLALAEIDRVLLPGGRLALTDRLDGGAFSAMAEVLRTQHYSVVTKPLRGGITLLYAVKPGP